MFLERNAVPGGAHTLGYDDDEPVVITAPEMPDDEESIAGRPYHRTDDAELADEELSLELQVVVDEPRTTTGPLVLDRGAPLDSVPLAGVMPGALAGAARRRQSVGYHRDPARR